MFASSLLKHVSIGLPGFLVATTAFASSGGNVTAVGATTGMPAVVVISAACALVLTLIFRPALSSASRTWVKQNRERRLRRRLDATGLEVLHNFILPGRCGGLTRIDHAILAAGGVVSVQVKHYSGTVFGDADDPQWTCTEGTERHQFMNPVIQNDGRAAAIRQAVPGLPVVSLIVFTGRVEFAKQKPDNVIACHQLQTYLDRIDFEPCAIEDWDTAWLSLRAAALTDDESRKDLDAQLSFG